MLCPTCGAFLSIPLRPSNQCGLPDRHSAVIIALACALLPAKLDLSGGFVLVRIRGEFSRAVHFQCFTCFTVAARPRYFATSS